jgi:hypothetical protein
MEISRAKPAKIAKLKDQILLGARVGAFARLASLAREDLVLPKVRSRGNVREPVVQSAQRFFFSQSPLGVLGASAVKCFS